MKGFGLRAKGHEARCFARKKMSSASLQSFSELSEPAPVKFEHKPSVGTWKLQLPKKWPILEESKAQTPTQVGQASIQKEVRKEVAKELGCVMSILPKICQ